MQLLVSTGDVDNYKRIKTSLEQLKQLVEESELWVQKSPQLDGSRTKVYYITHLYYTHTHTHYTHAHTHTHYIYIYIHKDLYLFSVSRVWLVVTLLRILAMLL